MATVYAPLPVLTTGDIASPEGPNAAETSPLQSHRGIFRWGWDFEVTTSFVISFATATVVDLHDGFETFGESPPDERPDFALGNFITLRYDLPDGTAVFATYAHLAEGFRQLLVGPDEDPASIGAGTVLRRGIIAATGLSGLTVDETTDIELLHVHVGTRTTTLTEGGTTIVIADGSADDAAPVNFGDWEEAYPGFEPFVYVPDLPAVFHSASGIVMDENPDPDVGFGSLNRDVFFRKV